VLQDHVPGESHVSGTGTRTAARKAGTAGGKKNGAPKRPVFLGQPDCYAAIRWPSVIPLFHTMLPMATRSMKL
jgi:hypothetical protein